METYETQEMTRSEALSFTTWHSNTVGTEHELNMVGDLDAYVMAWDMLPIEIGLCRAWEQSHIPAPSTADVERGRVGVKGWIL